MCVIFSSSGSLRMRLISQFSRASGARFSETDDSPETVVRRWILPAKLKALLGSSTLLSQVVAGKDLMVESKSPLFGIAPSGAVDPNYTITYAPGTLTVTQAALTITANDVTSVYGSTPVLDGVTYSGFVNGDKADSLTTQPGVSTTATSASPVGTYPTTASGAVDPNYTITYAPGTLTVTQAALTITANDATSVYGSTSVLDGVTYSGFVNGDKADSLTTQPGVSTTATSASPVGTYPTTASGAVDPNYTITYASGTLTVTQAALTITANDATSVYGSTPVLDGVTYSGFVNGDKADSLTTQPGVSTTATSASPVGTYPTTASGAVDPNYTITYAPGTLTVTTSKPCWDISDHRLWRCRSQLHLHLRAWH